MFPFGYHIFLCGNEMLLFGNDMCLFLNDMFLFLNDMFLFGNDMFLLGNDMFLFGNDLFLFGNDMFLLGNVTASVRYLAGADPPTHPPTKITLVINLDENFSPYTWLIERNGISWRDVVETVRETYTANYA